MLTKYIQNSGLKTVSLLLVIVIAVGISIVGGIRGKVMLPAIGDYSVTGKFTIEGTYPVNSVSLELVKNSYPDIPLWGSWVDNDVNTGEIVSSQFPAPNAIQIFLAGYPSKPQIKIYLENVNTKEKILLKANDSGEKWVSSFWILPLSWQGNNIRIVAIDNDKGIGGWVGISSPIAITWISIIQSQISALQLPLTYIFCFFLWLLPGISLLISTNLSRKTPSLFKLPISLMGSALTSYIIFWIYFVNNNLGRGISILVFVISLIYLTILHTQYLKLVKDRDFQIPLLIMFLVGLLYLCILYIPNFNAFDNHLASTRFFFARPSDNLIPHEFAERIYSGEDARNQLGDWLSSDRPPLQSAIELMIYPIINWYQIIGTIVQVSCISSLWTLCRVLKLPIKHISIVLGFSIFSGFLMYNSIYVWPKLLAASLVILAISLIMHESNQCDLIQKVYLSKLNIGYVAISLALGMLAHTGIFFTVIGLVIVFMAKGYLNPIRQPRVIAFGVVIFLVIYSPWITYQKLYDPPGNRLLKMHFAGVDKIDKRSFGEAVIDSYKNITLQEVLKRRFENVKTLTGFTEISLSSIHSPNPDLIRDAQNNSIIMWRTADRELLSRTLGILNIGWLFLFFNLFLRKKDATSTQLLELLYISLLGVLSASLLYFNGGATVTTHLSYADILLLFTVLSIEIVRSSKFLGYILLTLQLAYLIFVWLVESQSNPLYILRTAPNLIMLTLSSIISFCLICLLIKPKQIQDN